MIVIRSSILYQNKIIKSYINNSKLLACPLFINYSTVNFILYFTKSTLTVLNNHDNTHILITSKETENYKIKMIYIIYISFYILYNEKSYYEKSSNLLSSRHVEREFVNNQ